ncbi:MAG: hypothetical protein EOM76_10700 [Sphingobacteriia bacterium]|nr:hypothetical protein [Sphingobacteriia bacterium]
MSKQLININLNIINNDKELKRRFAEMKAIQKQLVNAKTIQKPKALNQFQTQYDEIRSSIENDPMIEMYLDLQQELNDLLIEIKEIIENEINSFPSSLLHSFDHPGYVLASAQSS